MFGATNKVENSDKEKWVYSGNGITFDRVGSWHFGNDFATNAIIFGADNSLLSNTDNHKNNFLILQEISTYGINGSFGSPGKKNSTNLVKQKTKFCVGLHYNCNNSYLIVNKKKSLNLKLTIKMLISNSVLSRKLIQWICSCLF